MQFHDFKVVKNSISNLLLQDYTGANMTVDNFLAAMAGDRKSLKGGSGKVLSTNSNDRIFFFYSGHGNTGSLGRCGIHINYILTKWSLYIYVIKT